jgi:RND family efflux transporter MFP subunit
MKAPRSKLHSAWRAIAAIGPLLIIRCAVAVAQTESVVVRVVPLPDSVAEVFSPAAARTISPREKFYNVGDKVKKGDPIIILEHRYNLHDAAHISNLRWDLLKVKLETQYRATEARVARERGERLVNLGNMSGQQLQQLKAEELQAKAEYDKARTLLEQQDQQIGNQALVRRPLTAPIDGEIAEATFTQNQLVYEGFKLYRIVNLSQVGITAHIKEEDFRPLPLGAKARFSFDSLAGKVFTGSLEIIAPAADPDTRTRELTFRVDNPDQLLRFGMIGRMEPTR